jgi:hypothetical protein
MDGGANGRPESENINNNQYTIRNVERIFSALPQKKLTAKEKKKLEEEKKKLEEE